MNYIKLSKEVSYALRHNPIKYDLKLDDEGWEKVENLLSSLNKEDKWDGVTQAHLEHIIETSDKKRFEMKDGKIRALYGHSIGKKISKKASIPPRKLYHGTARRFLKSIEKNGLIPKGRQYVHLSFDIKTAMDVGKRHDAKAIILEIDAEAAYKNGVQFYYGNDSVWLADNIPTEFLKLLIKE